MLETNKIHFGDARQLVRQLDPHSVDCLVTSVPYWSLRNYEIDGQFGLEPTPEQYVTDMADFFDLCWPVLKDVGTCWINIGDTYWGGKGQSGSDSPEKVRGKSRQPRASAIGGKGYTKPSDGKHPDIKPKDLVGIPWMLAFEMRRRGWYWRQDITWVKTNAMPDPFNDRCSRVHEQIMMFSKVGTGYFYDAYAIATPYSEKTQSTWKTKKKGKQHFNAFVKTDNFNASITDYKPKVWLDEKGDPLPEKRANAKDVWQIATDRIPEKHPARFPEELPRLCMLAGCPVGGLSGWRACLGSVHRVGDDWIGRPQGKPELHWL